MKVIWNVIFRVHKWMFMGTQPHLLFMHYSGFLNIRAELRRRQWKIRHPTIGKAGFRTPVGVHPRRRKWPAWAYTIMSVLFEKFFLFLAMLSPCGIIVPRPGIEPRPLHWGQRVLTAGPPGKAWESFVFFFLTALCFAECFSHLWVHLSTAPSNDRGKPCWLCCLAFREGVPSMSHAGLLSEWNDTLSILFLSCLFISLMNIVRGHRRKWENIEK